MCHTHPHAEGMALLALCSNPPATYANRILPGYEQGGRSGLTWRRGSRLKEESVDCPLIVALPASRPPRRAVAWSLGLRFRFQGKGADVVEPLRDFFLVWTFPVVAWIR
jgi:hypothetical protein